MDNKSLEKRVLKRTKMVVGLRISQSENNTSQLLVHTLASVLPARRSALYESTSDPEACSFSNRGIIALNVV
jgi:hypothetical protein